MKRVEQATREEEEAEQKTSCALSYCRCSSSRRRLHQSHSDDSFTRCTFCLSGRDFDHAVPRLTSSAREAEAVAAAGASETAAHSPYMAVNVRESFFFLVYLLSLLSL